MKQYYLYEGAQQQGPFSFEALKEKNVSADSLIWHEGLNDWQKAGEIEELKILFKAGPPPVPVAFQNPPIPSSKVDYQAQPSYDNQKSNKLFGINKNAFIVGILGIAFIICITAFSNYNDNKETEVRQNAAVEEALQEQNAKLAELERLEKERKERERQLAIQNRIKEINSSLDVAYKNLDSAKRTLNDVSGFKLLRSSGERHEQISEAEDTVKSWENEVKTLEKEMIKLNPNWSANQ